MQQLHYHIIDTNVYAKINGAGHNYDKELPVYLGIIAKNIKTYIALIETNNQRRKPFFKELLLQIYITKNHWCNHTVRYEKPPKIKEAFNAFFDQIILLMKTIEKTKKALHIEKKFLRSTKYIGLLHREIGYPHNKKVPKDFKLELKYDNSFCSWNANADVHKISRMREGDKYNIRITAKSMDNNYGFYITGFNRFFNKVFSKKYGNIHNEDEVVFKMQKECVISTEKIFLNI